MKYLFLHVIGWTALVLFFYYNICYLIALIKRRNDVADIAWGPGFVIAALVPLFIQGVMIDRSILVTTFVVIWAARLTLHIHHRSKNTDEDFRYRMWRESWGRYFYIKTYLFVFLLQGTILIFVVMPVIIINTYRGSGATFFDYFGILIWIIGFIFESISDVQLRNFLKQPENKGKIMQSGLWRYSRHPNYFGEVLQWWGLFIIGLSVPHGWLGAVGPILITLLITKVSGIPLLEKNMDGNLEFELYKKRTSIFFPIPPGWIIKQN